MKKVLLSVLILVSTIALGQDKFSMTVGSELMNFERQNFIIDTSYKLGDRTSISSWSMYATGRDEQMGGNYIVSANLINFKSKNYRATYSTGYQFLSIPLHNVNRHSFVIRASYKLF